MHGDFNPGNILSATREPWLATDPHPMVGDPAYDPSQLLLQVDSPFACPDPAAVLAHRFELFGGLIGEDPRRLLAWGVAARSSTRCGSGTAGEYENFGCERWTRSRSLPNSQGCERALQEERRAEAVGVGVVE